MSALLALIVLAGAAWLVLSATGGRRRAPRGPVDSVTEFSRAMHALDPSTRPRPRP